MPKVFASDSMNETEREKKHADLARRAGAECIVLLENDGILPLPADIPAALYGEGARHTVRGGTGSGDVNTRSDVNIEQGLTDAGYRITSTAWLDRQDEAFAKALQDYDARMTQMAQEMGADEGMLRLLTPFKRPAPVLITNEDIEKSPADVAIYVISRTSGEGADRRAEKGDYELTDAETEEIRRLANAYPGVVVVLNTASVISMTELTEIPGVRAIVLMGQLGSTGGDALADVLSGKTTPSGKLTDTWAKNYSDYPAADTFSHNNGDLSDEYYTEGIYVGYRYFDSFGVSPLYPFGYGKSYTTFTLSKAAVTTDSEEICVRTTVTNAGSKHSGREVVQIYVSAPASDIRRPYQSLVGYAKTKTLAPGESEEIAVRFQARDMASYDTKSAAWVLEPGCYIVRMGTSSADTVPAAVLTLSEQARTAQLKNLFRDSDPVKEMTAPQLPAEDVPASVPRIAIDPNAIGCFTAVYPGVRTPYEAAAEGTLTASDVYSGACTVEELTAQLTVHEMAELCVGTLRTGGSVVGEASHAVAGAAGDTSSILEKSRGIRGLVMADGPAGLRLTPVFQTDSSGRVLSAGEDTGDAVTYYQYCTAIPVGTALAQSWNEELIEELGRMIGEEMELFGVDIWLAPAMNIHRNPLCGRNFEYFSEDPLISGKCAAAMTRGVQSHPHKAVTVKHFAVNNQEDNRYFTNAHVGEQALREIYLRGFQIAIMETQPVAVMTSYNLLNGVHTANDYDLLQCACRDEWGFQGFIMTDWFTSVDLPELTGGRPHKYPISSSTGCIYAGNDVQMPGSAKNVEDIELGVEQGGIVDRFQITLADLQFCAANVVRAVLRLSAGT